MDKKRAVLMERVAKLLEEMEKIRELLKHKKEKKKE